MRKLIAALAALLVAGTAHAQSTTGNGVTVLSGPFWNNPVFTGTVTHPDGSTWTGAGFSDSSAYTTASTSIWNYAPSISLSGTGSYFADVWNPAITPTGASVGSLIGTSANVTLGASSLTPIAALRALSTQVSATNYTGTLSAAQNIFILGPALGTNPITTWAGLQTGAVTNGTGIVTGTVNNIDLNIAMPSGGAAAGGTVVNTGLQITGAGGTGAGTNTNYAINSASTAQVFLGGTLTVGTLSTGTGSFVCETGGLFTVEATTCATSAKRLKNPVGQLSDDRALDGVLSVVPVSFTYKDTAQHGAAEHVGLYADDLCVLDERLCVRNADNQVESFDDRGLLAYLVGSVRAQQQQIRHDRFAIALLGFSAIAMAGIAYWRRRTS